MAMGPDDLHGQHLSPPYLKPDPAGRGGPSAPTATNSTSGGRHLTAASTRCPATHSGCWRGIQPSATAASGRNPFRRADIQAEPALKQRSDPAAAEPSVFFHGNRHVASQSHLLAPSSNLWMARGQQRLGLHVDALQAQVLQVFQGTFPDAWRLGTNLGQHG